MSLHGGKMLRRASASIRRFSTSPATVASELPTSHRRHHEFLPPTSYVNSWKPTRDPKEATAQLASLRRDYDRQVKQLRKEYIKEMELLRIEKLRKDEARKEALRIANEERKAAKDAKKKAEAIERQAAEEERRQMLAKERADKLEYWRMREKKIEEKKKAKSDLVRRQSSLWIDESTIERKTLEALHPSFPFENMNRSN